MERKSHWEEVYQSKDPQEVSWYQPHSERSLQLIREQAPDDATAIIDVGGGASTLVDDLLAAGYRELAVLDLSGVALQRTQERLGTSACAIQWIEADVLEVELPQAGFDVWHDRAVFHFLTSSRDQQRYVAQVRHALRPRGYIVISTFAEDGPSRCSGLEVQRYSPESLQAVFGTDLRLVHSSRELHVTPAGREQAFIYCVFQAS